MRKDFEIKYRWLKRKKYPLEKKIDGRYYYYGKSLIEIRWTGEETEER